MKFVDAYFYVIGHGLPYNPPMFLQIGCGFSCQLQSESVWFSFSITAHLFELVSFLNVIYLLISLLLVSTVPMQIFHITAKDKSLGCKHFIFQVHYYNLCSNSFPESIIIQPFVQTFQNAMQINSWSSFYPGTVFSPRSTLLLKDLAVDLFRFKSSDLIFKCVKRFSFSPLEWIIQLIWTPGLYSDLCLEKWFWCEWYKIFLMFRNMFKMLL